MTQTQPANRSKQQQAQHTPGPWRCLSRFSHAVYGNNYLVADCEAVGAPNNDEETEANARLIAAAPELLAALERMVEAYREDVPDALQPTMVKRALIAIAEAKGR